MTVAMPNDGSSNAPSGTAQHPDLLSGYTTRPPWMVAGVDYAVGVPAGIALKDPVTLNQPGVSVDIVNHVVTITGNNVTIKGYDFSLEGGLWHIDDQGTNNTVTQSNFKVGTSYDRRDSVVSGGTNFTFTYNTIDGGGNPNSTTQPWDANTVYNSLVGGGGNDVVEYNWFKNSASQNFDAGGGGSVKFSYNVIENSALVLSVHNNFIQFYSGTYNNSIDISFNTGIQNALGGNIYGPGEGLQVDAQGGSSINGASIQNNVVIAKPIANHQPGLGLSFNIAVHGDASNPNTNPIIENNYLDTSGSYGEINIDDGISATIAGNVELVNGPSRPAAVTQSQPTVTQPTVTPISPAPPVVPAIPSIQPIASAPTSIPADVASVSSPSSAGNLKPTPVVVLSANPTGGPVASAGNLINQTSSGSPATPASNPVSASVTSSPIQTADGQPSPTTLSSHHSRHIHAGQSHRSVSSPSSAGNPKPGSPATQVSNPVSASVTPSPIQTADGQPSPTKIAGQSPTALGDKAAVASPAAPLSVLSSINPSTLMADTHLSNVVTLLNQYAAAGFGNKADQGLTFTANPAGGGADFRGLMLAGGALDQPSRDSSHLTFGGKGII
jgi:hypothetical protein